MKHTIVQPSGRWWVYLSNEIHVNGGSKKHLGSLHMLVLTARLLGGVSYNIEKVILRVLGFPRPFWHLLFLTRERNLVVLHGWKIVRSCSTDMLS